MPTNKHSAKPSGNGYLFQFLYALLLSLEKGKTSEGLRVSIENFDDIAFEDKNGNPVELIQSKHSSVPKKLNDSSIDLWKTLYIWCERLKTQKTINEIFILVTTSSASPKSIAKYLSIENAERDTDLAVNLILEKAKALKGKDTKIYRDYICNKTPHFLKTLCEMIFVIGSVKQIGELENEISNSVFIAVRKKDRKPLYESFTGWWLQQVILLLDASNRSISIDQITTKLQDLAYQLHNDDLPIEFLGIEPSWSENWEMKTFVKQLRLIFLNDSGVKNAVRDYYRAFEQRSKWAKDDLLIDDELKKYESKLSEEWERRRDAFHADVDLSNTQDQQKVGMKLFNWMSTSANYPIRRYVSEEYVTRGSYHILADRLEVGWHPEFLKKLKEILQDE
jgi:hypothetical protein